MIQIGVTSMHVQSYNVQQNQYTPQLSGNTETRSPDRLDIGSGGISADDATKVITDRVLARIKEAVGEAKAMFGISSGPLDTSPEATADRIFNFAVGFYDAFCIQHPELDDETSRESFVDLVWGAVQQGIQESRDILAVIAPIDEPVSADIDKIARILENKFTQFLESNSPESASGIVAPAWSAMTT